MIRYKEGFWDFLPLRKWLDRDKHQRETAACLSSSPWRAYTRRASAAEKADMILSISSEILLFHNTHNTPSVTKFVLLKIDTHAVEKIKYKVKIWVIGLERGRIHVLKESGFLTLLWESTSTTTWPIPPTVLDKVMVSGYPFLFILNKVFNF
jgi:hypothetical protein